MGNRPDIIGETDPTLTVGHIGFKARDLFIDYWEAFNLSVKDHTELRLLRRSIRKNPFSVSSSERIAPNHLLFSDNAFVEFSLGKLARIEIVPWKSDEPGLMQSMTKYLHCGHLLDVIDQPFIWNVGAYSGPGAESFSRAVMGTLAIAMRGAVTAEHPHHLIDDRTVGGEELLELYFRPWEGKSERWLNIERERSDILKTLEENGMGSVEECD